MPGLGEIPWARFISTLNEVGYDDVLSIEHEDSLMSVNEGPPFTFIVDIFSFFVREESINEITTRDIKTMPAFMKKFTSCACLALVLRCKPKKVMP